MADRHSWHTDLCSRAVVELVSCTFRASRSQYTLGEMDTMPFPHNGYFYFFWKENIDWLSTCIEPNSDLRHM